MNARTTAAGLAVALLMAACAREQPRPSDALPAAREALKVPVFDDAFDRTLALLDEVARQRQDLPAAYEARLLIAKAHLDLLLSAYLSRDPACYERLKRLLGWTLEGDLTSVRNFQALCQEILEEFRLVAREAPAAAPALVEPSQALRDVTAGLQGAFYRNKDSYFAGRTAVARLPDYQYIDDILSIRDLTEEVLHREDEPGKNWQNIVLTVIGRFCPKGAARFVATACSPPSLAEATEFCNPDARSLSEGTLKTAWAFLVTECRMTGRNGLPDARTAIQGFYGAALSRLARDPSLLPAPLAEYVASRGPEVARAVDVLFATLGTPQP
jgi:hypothetical protein